MNLLKGKKCLITGASSGLGLELTKLFVQQGAEVIMLCRDEKKGTAIIQNIIHEKPDAQIYLELADLASLQSVYSFINRVKTKYTKLDMLINNAAILKTEITKTIDGFESMFQVNYLSPFIITNSLVDLLKLGTNAKIINITLPPEKYQLNLDDLQSLNSYKPMEVLFKTKLCLLLFTLEFAERIKDSNIAVVAGVPNKKPFKSGLGREMPAIMRFIMRLISTDANKVAQNILYHASKDNLKTGTVFNEKEIVPLASSWKDTNLRMELWNQTNNVIDNWLGAN